MYRNVAADILPNQEFLMRFYENVIGNATHELNREDVICSSLFEHPELLHNVPPSDAFVK